MMDTHTSPTRSSDLTLAEQAWRMAAGQLRMQLDRATFDAYIRDARAVDFDGAALTVAAPSAYARDWMVSRLAALVRRHVEPIFGQPVVVRFVFDDPQAAARTGNTPGSDAISRPNTPEPIHANTTDLPAAPGPQSRGTGSAAEWEKSGQFRVADQQVPPTGMNRAQNGLPEADSGADASADAPANAPIPPFPGAQQSQNHPVDAPRRDGSAIGQGPHAATAPQSGDSYTLPAIISPAHSADQPAADEPTAPPAGEPGEESDGCASIILQEAADTVEAALLQSGRIVAFPRYELRFIPLVGPEAFFLRLAFLQERFLNTPPEGRARPFETTVESLLRWANVGRATLHRFKKGDPARGQQPAAGWFGIEQMLSAPRSANSQQQPPCRYRLQQGIPLTPMDADRLLDLLTAAGIQDDPLAALESLTRRPVQEILPFPPPAPSEAQKQRAPAFTTVAGVVQAALGGKKLPPDLRAKVQEAAAQLADHVTNPGQVVFVSWYFLRHWLPLLGHDAAALVVFARAQGYYNPQDHELRDAVPVSGGYRELAQVIGLKRDRTIGDWLPNIFDREVSTTADESEKWQREQQRQQQTQARIGHFLQVIPGSRRKTAAGHYAFDLRVAIAAEPLTPADQALRGWVYRTLAACADANVLGHFHAWVTSPVIHTLVSGENDGAGILGAGRGDQQGAHQNDGWGILAIRQSTQQMTARESSPLDDDGWGILAAILDDGRGILAGSEMTVGELFKGLLRLNTFWETILKTVKTSSTPPAGDASDGAVVVTAWDMREICSRNGGMNKFREQIIAREPSAAPFIAWLIYAYSFKGRGIEDPIGWALSRLNDQPGSSAGAVYDRLSALPPARLAGLLRAHLEAGAPPMDDDWHFAFKDVPAARLRQMAEVLGVEG